MSRGTYYEVALTQIYWLSFEDYIFGEETKTVLGLTDNFEKAVEVARDTAELLAKTKADRQELKLTEEWTDHDFTVYTEDIRDPKRKLAQICVSATRKKFDY